MIDAIQIVTTTGSRQEADKIAEALVARRLAACVQVGGPITSTYRWQGKIETSQEWVCTIKTRRLHYASVEAAIAELHSYDVPEILAFSALAGGQKYLGWLAGELVDLAGPQTA
jgi:periplasmic divalent cation tolerance protein